MTNAHCSVGYLLYEVTASATHTPPSFSSSEQYVWRWFIELFNLYITSEGGGRGVPIVLIFFYAYPAQDTR